MSPEAADAPAGDRVREGAAPVIGLVTYNHARAAAAIGQTMREALAQLTTSMPRLIVADGGSTDGTLETIRGACAGVGELVAVPYALQPDDALDLPYHRLPGRARALRAILHEAQASAAGHCVVLDPATAAAGPDLVGPLVDAALGMEGDLVTPRYTRHPFSGALIHGLVYPLFRSLYGTRIRYPTAADFVCSPRFAESVLADPIWETDRGQVGIDMWLASTAVTGGFAVTEVVVPPAPREDREGPDLATTIRQIVGFLFTEMEKRVPAWQRARVSRPLPARRSLGEGGRSSGAAPVGVPEGPDVNVAQLVESFHLGWRELQEVWAEVLPPLAILQWRRLAASPLAAFRVEDALWARTVYDFAMGHRLRVIARDHLLRSLAPLYLAWLASFVVELRHAPPAVSEERIERLCQVFETEKPYLISLWRWPERFRPARIRR